ncbi:MAG: UvrD-helicase domain-containing protein [Phycisphaerae bacterium]|nr:UvrD-helicase domain-containing protein [Phycisphaerae bacterium]
MTRPKLTPAQTQAAITTAGKNTALLSGAGCGKTFVLARRFTELLMRHPDANDPRALADAMGRFVALTFTDKAAMEMSRRVRSMLRDLADQAGSAADRNVLLGWLDAASEARISTIHSFCAGVLRSCAIQAGIDPAFTVCAETAVTDRMLAEATEEAILAALEESDDRTARLLNEISFQRLCKLVRFLVRQRTHYDFHAYADPAKTLARWREILQKERQAAQQRLKDDGALHRPASELEQFVCTDPDDKLLPFVTSARSSLRTILTQPLEQCARAFAELAAAAKCGNVGSKKAWSVAPIEIRATLRSLAAAGEEYAPMAEDFSEIDEHAAAVIATLTRLASRADDLYRQAKRSRSLLDFDDLILHTRNLLQRDENPRKRLAAGVDQLLIDEAQDTDATQVQLLLSLLREEPHTLPDEGKLFLVGDAKQSIYRFRGAQVEVFEELCETLGPTRRVDLDISFRTHEAGTCFVNDVFAPMMADAYTPIRAHRTIPPDHPSVEILLAEASESGEFEDAEFATAAQASLTAQRVAEMIAGGEKLVWDDESQTYRPVRAGDIAILFSRMTKSLPFERELQKRNLPYYVVAGSGFFHQQEIHDVLNALKAIENPFDDLAVIGVLRSVMFSLSDDALLHLARTHTPPYLPDLNPELLAGKIDETQLDSLRFAKELLNRLARQKDAMGVDELLRRVLDETGYEAMLSAQPRGKRMTGNVRLLLDQAQAAAGQMSLADFLAEMDEQILSESRFEQAAVAGEAEDVIRLMTIHKAKGLEFPVVFVPDLNRGWRVGGDLILTRLDWGLTTKLTPGWEESKDDIPVPLAHRLATTAESRDQAREMIRNYYVALTRHEDHLVLVGADLRDKDGRFKDSRSFLAQLDDVLHLRERLDDGEASLPYADGKFSAVLRRETPKEPKNVMLSKIDKSDSNQPVVSPSLLGPLPETLGDTELAVTALSDFEHCPAAFHWRYELQCPEFDCGLRIADLSPATLGTLLHRCMELYDFSHPQPAGELIERVLFERDDLPPVQAEELTAQLEGMLTTFRDQSLAGELAAATEMHRELDFLLRVGRMTLRGQIDLLYRDAAGMWRIVDYKSDRAGTPEDMDHKLEHYELQLLTYALAVSRFAGSSPTDASLYFLRTGQVRSISLTDEILTASEKRIETLATKLITARRENQFPGCGKESCYFCQRPTILPARSGSSSGVFRVAD